MLGLPSRSGQRKEPSWTQAPSSGAQSEPVWKDDVSAAAHEPSRYQGQAPRKAYRFWFSLVLAVAGLLAVAYLLLSMVEVVEEQMARNQPQAPSAAARPAMTLVSSPDGGARSVGGPVTR
ncbi:MAG: hypothetical protein RR283_05615 [Comamonas sp.]